MKIEIEYREDGNTVYTNAVGMFEHFPQIGERVEIDDHERPVLTIVYCMKDRNEGDYMLADKIKIRLGAAVN